MRTETAMFWDAKKITFEPFYLGCQSAVGEELNFFMPGQVKSNVLLKLKLDIEFAESKLPYQNKIIYISGSLREIVTQQETFQCKLPTSIFHIDLAIDTDTINESTLALTLSDVMILPNHLGPSQ